MIVATPPPQTIRYKISRSGYGAFGTVVSGKSDRLRGLQWMAFGFLWLLVFTIAWENVLILPGFGTVGKLVGVLAFGAGLFAVIDRGTLRKFALLQGIMAMFVIWGCFTYFWSYAPERTKEEVVTYLQLFLMVWLIREFARTKQLQRQLMSAYVLGTYVSAACTFAVFGSGASTAHYHRYAAQGFNPGDLALMVVLSVPFSIYLSSTQRKGLLLWIYRIHPAVAAACVFFTAARGAFIDLFVALLFLPLAFRQWSIRQRLSLGIIAVGGLVAISLLVPQTSWTRLSSIGQEVSSGTLNERTTLWKAGFEVFRMHPLQGVGVNAFAPTVQRSLGAPAQLRNGPANEVVEYVAHNTFISVLVEEGIVGFTLFVGLLLALWRGIFRLEGLERRLWIITLLVWTLGVMELTWEYRKPTWMLFGLLSAAIASVRSDADGRRAKLA